MEVREEKGRRDMRSVVLLINILLELKESSRELFAGIRAMSGMFHRHLGA
jgi:hypothetical protein